MLKPGFRKEKKDDLSDFEDVVSVGAKRAGLSIWEAVEIEFKQKMSEKDKIQWTAVLWAKMPCWSQRSEGNWLDYFELIGR